MCKLKIKKIKGKGEGREKKKPSWVPVIDDCLQLLGAYRELQKDFLKAVKENSN